MLGLLLGPVRILMVFCAIPFLYVFRVLCATLPAYDQYKLAVREGVFNQMNTLIGSSLKTMAETLSAEDPEVRATKKKEIESLLIRARKEEIAHTQLPAYSNWLFKLDDLVTHIGLVPNCTLASTDLSQLYYTVVTGYEQYKAAYFKTYLEVYDLEDWDKLPVIVREVGSA